MKNLTITLTDEQYRTISEFILENKMNGGEFKSFSSIFRSITDEFVASMDNVQQHINKK